MRVLLGSGILNWDGAERRSDRYGSVTLWDGNKAVKLVPCQGRGRLIVEVKQSCKSSHVGDWFRGLNPRQTPVGTVVVLNDQPGELFYDQKERSVGVTPDEERESDWLNPRALYDVHEHVVNLYFEPEGAQS
jgi:hypothetical protein